MKKIIFSNYEAANSENYDIFIDEDLNEKLIKISNEILEKLEKQWSKVFDKDDNIYDKIGKIIDEIHFLEEYYPENEEIEILYANSIELEKDLSEETIQVLKETSEIFDLAFKKIEIQNENSRNFYNLALDIYASWENFDNIWEILYWAKDSHFEKDWFKFNWHFWITNEELENIYDIIYSRDLEKVFEFLIKIFIISYKEEFNLTDDDLLYYDLEYELKENAIKFLNELSPYSFNLPVLKVYSKDGEEFFINNTFFENERKNFIEKFSEFYEVTDLEFFYGTKKIDKNNSEISFLEAVYKNLENFSDKEIFFKNLKKDFFEVWEKYEISKNKSKVELKKFKKFFENLDLENQDFESENFQKVIDLAIIFLLLFEYNETMFDWEYDFYDEENKESLTNEIIDILEKMWFSRKLETFRNLKEIDFFDRFYKLKLNFIEI